MQEKARKLFIVDWWFPFALRIVQLACCIVATALARNVLTYGTYTEVESACWILALVISACAVLCLPIMIHFEFWDRPSKWRASRRVLQLRRLGFHHRQLGYYGIRLLHRRYVSTRPSNDSSSEACTSDHDCRCAPGLGRDLPYPHAQVSASTCFAIWVADAFYRGMD